MSRSLGRLPVLAVASLATLVCLPLMVHGQPMLSLDTPSGTFSPGATVNVPITLTLGSQDLSGITLDITYDSNLLAYSGVSIPTTSSGGVVPPSWGNYPTSGPAGTGLGYVDVQLYQQATLAYIASSGTVMSLQFQVSSSATTAFAPIYFSALSYQEVTNSTGGDVTSQYTFNSGTGGVNVVGSYSGTSTWTSPFSGTWSTSSNWDSRPPENPGEKAVFSGSLASSLTVTLDGPDIAGGLTFSNSAGGATGYVLAPASSATGTLTLDNSGSTIPLQVLSGSNSISAPITLAGNLAISESAGSSLAISGNIGQSTTAGLTLSGDGRLILSGSDSYTGGTTIAGGELVIESGKALPFGENLTIGAGSVFVFDPSLVAGGASQPAGLSAASVPEPSTLALAVALLCSAAIYTVRGRK